MFSRNVVTASAAALAVIALSAPVVSAQVGIADPTPAGSESGSLDAGSLLGGSLDGGSLDVSSLDGGSLDAGSLPGDSAEGSSGDEGSLDTESADDSSIGDLVPESEARCELPELGGSVAKFYPLFGISGVPTGVLDIVTSALNSFPNLLDVVAGPGGGAALVGQSGSLSESLCTSIFGGEMVLPPVVVIIDENGTPISTTVANTADLDSGSDAAGATTSPVGAGSSSATDDDDAAAGTGTVALATSVPTPAG